MPGMKSVPLPKVLQLLDELPAKYACLAAIGVTTGCRITELLLLQRHDLLNSEGGIKEEIAFVKLKSRKKKKNSEEKRVVHRKLSIPEDFHIYIIRHLREEEQRGFDMPSDFVFRGKNGKPLSRYTCYNKFRSMLGGGHGTHWMRKTFGRELFRYFLKQDRTDPMRALELTRQALDHERLETTVRYLGINENKITTVQRAIFNKERIRKDG